jgi:hypothetical protein
MTAQDIYRILDNAGIEYEVVEIFEGARWLRIEVEEEEEDNLCLVPEGIQEPDESPVSRRTGAYAYSFQRQCSSKGNLFVASKRHI